MLSAFPLGSPQDDRRERLLSILTPIFQVSAVDRAEGFVKAREFLDDLEDLVFVRATQGAVAATPAVRAEVESTVDAKKAEIAALVHDTASSAVKPMVIAAGVAGVLGLVAGGVALYMTWRK